MLKGFTLLEILIVMALTSIFAVILFPFTIGTVNNQNLAAESANFASTLFKIQQDAFASENDSHYGIRFNTSSYSILSGSNLAAMNIVETFNLSSPLFLTSINLTGGATEILFAKNSLRPNVTGSFILSNGSESYIFTINNEGLIEYQKN